jgi:cell division septation protein DedD
MENDNKDLDLLDLEDDETLSAAAPACSPFATPRPARPWLLMGLGVLIIVLATYIIVRAVGTDSGTSVEIDLDVPPVETTDAAPATPDTLVVPPLPAPKPAPAAVAAVPPATVGVPTRQIADRNDTATFRPDAPAAKPAPAAKSAAPAPAPKPAAKPVVAPSGSFYVQFGSYSTRPLAESAQKKIQSSHRSLLGDRQFVILAAQVSGKTTYRLRVAFANQNDANMFCRNAKSDGLDCYVAK